MRNNTIDRYSDYTFIKYARKSQEDDDRQAASLPAQHIELDGMKEKLNLFVPYAFQEATSAFYPTRKEFYNMILLIEQEKANAILAWDVKRISRNMLDGGRIIHLLDQGKLKLILTPNGKFTSSASDKMNLTIAFSFAKRESDDKSEDIKRGNSYKFFTKRQWSGVAKPGFMNFYDSVKKERYIIKDPTRHPLIKKAIRRILYEGMTVLESLSVLNNHEGYRTRPTQKTGNKPLSKSVFYKLLSDPFIYGLMIRKEGEQIGVHEPYISKEEFDRLQIILGKRGLPYKKNFDFPYKKVLHCGECHGTVTAEEKWQIICSNCKLKFPRIDGRDKCPKCKTQIEEMPNCKILHYTYYHCAKKTTPSCSQKSITVEKLEHSISEELEKYTMPIEFIDWAVKYLTENKEIESKDNEIVKQNLNQLISNKKLQLKGLFNKWTSINNQSGTLMSDQEYEQARKALQDEIFTAEESLSQISHTLQRSLELSTKTFNFSLYAKHWLQEGDSKDKVEIALSIGQNLNLMDGKLVTDNKIPLFLIKKAKEHILSVVNRFEPENNGHLEGKHLLYDGVIPLLCSMSVWNNCITIVA